MLEEVQFVRGRDASLGSPARHEAHGAQGGRKEVPGGGAAAEDLLVGATELGAEGHVDDEVDGGVERL